MGRLARWVRTETNLAMCTIAERLVVRVATAAQGHTCVFADHMAAGIFNADVATDVERAVGPDIDGCCLQLPFLRPAVEALEMESPTRTGHDRLGNLVGRCSIYRDPRAGSRVENLRQTADTVSAVDA